MTNIDFKRYFPQRKYGDIHTYNGNMEKFANDLNAVACLPRFKRAGLNQVHVFGESEFLGTNSHPEDRMYTTDIFYEGKISGQDCSNSEIHHLTLTGISDEGYTKKNFPGREYTSNNLLRLQSLVERINSDLESQTFIENYTLIVPSVFGLLLGKQPVHNYRGLDS